MTPTNLNTKNILTWCPGCPNFMILASVKKAFGNLIAKGLRHEEIAIVTGIGCHAKIYDYLNVCGIYGLHGRVIPTAQGIKLGNKKLTVLGFAGDGDTYSEGMGHFASAGRHDIDMTLVVHNNQAFSLTTGQPTATSQKGYVSKASPFGEKRNAINPIKIALASGIKFVARCNAKDIEHTAEILEKAIKHKGFSYVEIIQDCLIFNKDFDASRDKRMYKIEDNSNKKTAESLADEWNYNSRDGKIAFGVIYEERN